MIHKDGRGMEEVSYCFSRSPVKFECHAGGKKWQFGPDLGVSERLLQFEITDGHEMTHIAYRSVKEDPYCFFRSLIKFKSHTGKKIDDFDQILAFTENNFSFKSQTVSMKHKALRGLEEVPYCFPRSFVPYLGYTGQINSQDLSQLSNPSELHCFVCGNAVLDSLYT